MLSSEIEVLLQSQDDEEGIEVVAQSWVPLVLYSIILSESVHTSTAPLEEGPAQALPSGKVPTPTRDGRVPFMLLDAESNVSCRSTASQSDFVEESPSPFQDEEMHLGSALGLRETLDRKILREHLVLIVLFTKQFLLLFLTRRSIQNPQFD
ncbi:hypothetical protein Nepgr_027105 [Nepenthes gracilis]|uniref:Uncharacterized protein n=1 Tax=Nepenthes gracilis TaxID=150966 RepID=A0AAD3TB60_NEPGR|nr:hypothetical protein Nepgr_027105 [Nepenthes gracilis]